MVKGVSSHRYKLASACMISGDVERALSSFVTHTLTRCVLSECPVYKKSQMCTFVCLKLNMFIGCLLVLCLVKLNMLIGYLLVLCLVSEEPSPCT
jgi:hypothetical protein